MTKTDTALTISTVLEGAAIVVLSLFLCKSCKKSENVIYIPVEVRDTISVDKERIVEHTKLKYVTHFDTLVTYVDTTHQDTVEVPIELPIEHKLYSDTLKTDSTDIELTVGYSGFKASLDTIGITYHYIGERPVEVKKRAFKQFVGIGIGAGISAGYDPIGKSAAIVAPGLQIGIVYGFGYTW